MSYKSNTYLSYFSPDSELHDLGELFQNKANRAARRDADLARRRMQRDRKVAQREDRTMLSTKGQ